MNAAARLILRIVVFATLLLVVGTVAVFSFVGVLEPFYAAFGEPPASLGWGEPGMLALEFSVVGFILLLAVLIVYFVVAPIQDDVRQEVR